MTVFLGTLAGAFPKALAIVGTMATVINILKGSIFMGKSEKKCEQKTW